MDLGQPPAFDLKSIPEKTTPLSDHYRRFSNVLPVVDLENDNQFVLLLKMPLSSDKKRRIDSVEEERRP